MATKTLRDRLFRWLTNNAVGIVIVFLTVMVNYETLTRTVQPLMVSVNNAVGVLTPILATLLFTAGVAGFGWLATKALDKLASLLVDRVVRERIAGIVSRVAALEEHNNRGEGRLARVEDHLGIGDHPFLNLPDNLPPESIKSQVRRFERERGFRHLWRTVEAQLKSSQSGYIAVEHHETGGKYTSGGASHCTSRSGAEARLRPGMVLVHVIESDWVTEINHRVTLDIDGLGDPFGDPHRERRPTFMSVDERPGGAYAFRMELQEDGKDDSTERVFDWWFDRLRQAVENSLANSKMRRPIVTIQDNLVEDTTLQQTMYVGELCVEEQSRPRRNTRNPSLFEFDLENVTLTITRQGSG